MIRINSHVIDKTAECISPLDFDCQSPLKFYVHFKKCARFNDDYHYLKKGLELFLREKVLCYDTSAASPMGV